MNEISQTTGVMKAGDGNTSLPERSDIVSAAEWLVRCKEGALSDREQLEFNEWLSVCESHQKAWALAMQFEQRMAALPARPALSALRAAKAKRQNRRSVLKGLTLLVGAGGASWFSYEAMAWRSWVAEHQTGVGEQRKIRLSDGGVIDMNTATTMDVNYSQQQRAVRLHAGEVLIETATDNQELARPFVVHTPHGRVHALGTRFSVRTEGGRTVVSVLEHAVEITPGQGLHALLRLNAGQQVAFSASEIGPVQMDDRTKHAWARGMLVVVDKRMDNFLAELGRYRKGRIACEASIAGLRVTGAYRVADTDHVLESLTMSHAVELRYFTRFWVGVGPRR